MRTETSEILAAVRDGRMSVEEAELKLRTEPFADIGYAKLDLHRRIRQGAGEVVYGAGKTAEQIAGIVRSLAGHGQERILVTRLAPEKAAALRKLLAGPEAAPGGLEAAPGDLEADADRLQAAAGCLEAAANACASFRYHEEARAAFFGDMPEPDGIGTILVATGGTSDIPVAEEAALTAEFLGNRVSRVYDVGVAGLHRLLPHLEDIASASVIIAIAGMEGALASVVGGLADCPVIAVPTSVGYGASFGGISALLSMLNSCASGVSVVNIDNGFGAGFLASRINHMK